VDELILVSIVVPVYNTENYIEKCIKSILVQTYKNFELILIDDGSPDKAGKICDSFCEKDKRIKCIHIKNGGVSNARNIGMKHATGRYIVFIDSDDWVTPDHIEKLRHVSSYGGLGACCFFTNEKNDETRIIEFTKSEGEVSIYSSAGIGGFPWNKIFDKKVIDQHQLKFDIRYTMCEDLLFSIQYIHFMPNVSIKWSQKQTYHYELTMGAVKGRFQVGHLFSQKDFSEYLAVKESRKYVSKTEAIKACNIRLAKAAVNSLRTLVAGKHMNCKEYTEMLTYVRQNLITLMLSSNMAKSSKLSACFSAISPCLEYRVYLMRTCTTPKVT
jgi:glycosyltransferase involved in cell wall biosynthesis